jgi:hypothetical protein
MNIFVPILKVDAVKREVYGIMAEEAVDKANEIFDYESSKPYVKAWAEEFHRVTNGASYGNVRAQHSSVAAGKLIGIGFDDEVKNIVVAAKIVDDNEWNKVAEGVYTGFSIGGKYVKKWTDGTATRYTANPSEVSIVDNPCMYGAQFTMVKEDGSEEMRKFAPAGQVVEKERPAPRFQTRSPFDVAVFNAENGGCVSKALGDNSARRPEDVVEFGNRGFAAVTASNDAAGVTKSAEEQAMDSLKAARSKPIPLGWRKS